MLAKNYRFFQYYKGEKGEEHLYLLTLSLSPVLHEYGISPKPSCFLLKHNIDYLISLSFPTFHSSAYCVNILAGILEM